MKIIWLIQHPGDGRFIEPESFEDAMKNWFEGFNIPIKITDGCFETFTESYERVQKWLEKKSKK